MKQPKGKPTASERFHTLAELLEALHHEHSDSESAPPPTLTVEWKGRKVTYTGNVVFGLCDSDGDIITGVIGEWRAKDLYEAAVKISFASVQTMLDKGEASYIRKETEG